jgi:hypothetical protein
MDDTELAREQFSLNHQASPADGRGAVIPRIWMWRVQTSITKNIHAA